MKKLLLAVFVCVAMSGCTDGTEKYKVKAESWAAVTVKPTDPVHEACDAANPEPRMAPGPKDDAQSARAYNNMKYWGREERSLRKKCSAWSHGQR